MAQQQRNIRKCTDVHWTLLLFLLPPTLPSGLLGAEVPAIVLPDAVAEVVVAAAWFTGEESRRQAIIVGKGHCLLHLNSVHVPRVGLVLKDNTDIVPDIIRGAILDWHSDSSYPSKCVHLVP